MAWSHEHKHTYQQDPLHQQQRLGSQHAASKNGGSSQHVKKCHNINKNKCPGAPPNNGYRRAAEPPATRQTRRNYDAAASQMPRQAHTSQHNMNAQDQARTRQAPPAAYAVVEARIGRLQTPLRPGRCAVTTVSPTSLTIVLGCTLRLHKTTRGIKRPETPAAMQTSSIYY